MLWYEVRVSCDRGLLATVMRDVALVCCGWMTGRAEGLSSDRDACMCSCVRLAVWALVLVSTATVRYTCERSPAVVRQSSHGRKADIWSVGCVVIEMATASSELWPHFSNTVSCCLRIVCARACVSRCIMGGRGKDHPCIALGWLYHTCCKQLSALYHIASAGRHPDIPQHLSPACQRFLARCFALNPANRATASELLDDPWLASVPGERD